MADNKARWIIAQIAANDPRRGELAKFVLGALAVDEDVATIDLAVVQRFAWYELEEKWIGPPELREATLDVAVELLNGLGLNRYAQVILGPVTARVHRAYARSVQEGRKVYQDAVERSGIDPPDLDDFAWRSFMGGEELRAAHAAAVTLEKAIDEGRFTPGTRGWRTTAKQVTAQTLDTPHPDLPGQTYRTAILTERVADWVRIAERHAPMLYELRSRFANRLLHPIPVPDDLDEHLAPVTWLLEHVAAGVTLTQADYLPTSLAREGWERFSWDRGWTDKPPRSESELPQLLVLHDLLHRAGLLRRRGRKLHATKRGIGLLHDPPQMWRRIATMLSGNEWTEAVAETCTFLLLSDIHGGKDLALRAFDVLKEFGWNLTKDQWGYSPVRPAWWHTARLLQILGGLTEEGPWSTRTYHFTPFGEATLLEQIRRRATGPRSTVF